MSIRRAGRRRTAGAALGGLVVAAIALATTACSPGSGLGAQQLAAATASPAVAAASTESRPAVSIPAAMLGTWTANVEGTTATSGTWTLRASAHDLELKNPHGTDDAFFSLNPTSADGTSIDLAQDPDCAAATYSWRLEQSKLVFDISADSCIDRKAVLTATPWIRQP